MRSDLSARVSLSGDPTQIQGWQDQAMREMVDATWWRIVDVTFADLPVDGIRTRWQVPGENVAILPAEKQLAPSGINMSAVAAPVAAPAVSASGTGSSLPAGTYTCAIAYLSQSGEGPLSPPATLRLNAGQNIVFAAMTLPTTGLLIVGVAYYYTDANGTVWKTWTSTGTGGAMTITAPGIAAAAGKPYTDRIAYAAIPWVQAAPDRVLVEEQVNADGTQVIPGSGAGPFCSITATTAPAPVGNVATTRVWYQRRVPLPDFTTPTSVLRVPEQFARICTIGYYLGIVSDNQAGGDMRQWRKKSDEYLQQAANLYNTQVPPIPLQKMQADDWLLTGKV
jgi:hypothetical protein